MECKAYLRKIKFLDNEDYNNYLNIFKYVEIQVTHVTYSATNIKCSFELTC